MKKYSQGQDCLVISRQQARAFDEWAINTLGIAGVVLMENAGRSCAELIMEKLASVAGVKVCIFCGTGNNGGDGYVIARFLLNAGFNVTTVICGDRNKIRGDAKINLDILERLNGVIELLDPADENSELKIEAFAQGAALAVDCLFGTGLSSPLKEDYQRLIVGINKLSCPILAVDVPSGLNCDTGEPLGASVTADYTVTFIALKKGFTFARSADYTGDIYIADIGVEAG